MEDEDGRFAFATRLSEAYRGTPKTQSDSESKKIEPSIKKSRPARPAGARSARLTPIARAKGVPTDLLEYVDPERAAHDVVLSSENIAALTSITEEVRRGDELRRHGLTPRSKLLFCGPPGCGKTLCAEVVAHELKLPLLIARLDGIITTYLGETATNIRKVFDAAIQSPSVIFLDEFDALARARTDTSEHNEIRRVVNTLLMMIDRFSGRGLLIAATNLESSIDRAVWRRFDEVLYFDLPTPVQIRQLLRLKTRNFKADFNLLSYEDRLRGLSYAEIERVCVNSIKKSILDHSSSISPETFDRAIIDEKRRLEIQRRVRAVD